MCISIQIRHHAAAFAIAMLTLVGSRAATAANPSDGGGFDAEAIRNGVSEAFSTSTVGDEGDGEGLLPASRFTGAPPGPWKYDEDFRSPEPAAVPLTYEEPDVTALRTLARRNHDNSVTAYIAGAIPAAIGVGLLVAGRCNPLDSHGNGYLCVDEDSRQRRLSLRSHAGFVLVGIGAVPALAMGLPAHRRSIRYSQLADAVEAGDVPDFSLLHFEVERLRTKGRNTRYAALGTTAATAALGVAAFTAPEMGQFAFRTVGFMTFGMTTLGLLFRGGNLHQRARRLEYQSPPRRPFNTTIIPRFLGDGAGADLHMSF